MPHDFHHSSKIYPDAMFSFKWEHSHEGTVEAGTFKTLGTIYSNGIPNHGQAKAQGYMYSGRDWRNVELKTDFDADTGDDFISLYMGGLGSDACRCCGAAYEMLFSSNGKIRLIKRTYYGNSVVMKTIDNGPLPSGWKGVCFCRYNVYRNTMVRLEAWVDKSGGLIGNWKQALVVVDNGTEFGKGGSKCGGSERGALTWGFPIVGFKAPFSFNYHGMIAREINAGGSFNEAGIGGGRARPTGGGGENPLPSSVL